MPDISPHSPSRCRSGCTPSLAPGSLQTTGRAILLAAVDRGARVMVTDRLPFRLALARELGADEVVDTTARELRPALDGWTAGEGPVVVFEATGVPAVLEEAVDVAASSGTVVIVGLSRGSVSLPMVELTRKELTVVGSRNSKSRFPAAVDLVRRHREEVGRLISHRFGFDRAPEAFALAHDQPQTTETVIIEVGGSG